MYVPLSIAERTTTWCSPDRNGPKYTGSGSLFQLIHRDHDQTAQKGFINILNESWKRDIAARNLPADLTQQLSLVSKRQFVNYVENFGAATSPGKMPLYGAFCPHILTIPLQTNHSVLKNTFLSTPRNSGSGRTTSGKWRLSSHWRHGLIQPLASFIVQTSPLTTSCRLPLLYNLQWL